MANRGMTVAKVLKNRRTCQRQTATAHVFSEPGSLVVIWCSHWHLVWCDYGFGVWSGPRYPVPPRTAAECTEAGTLMWRAATHAPATHRHAPATHWRVPKGHALSSCNVWREAHAGLGPSSVNCASCQLWMAAQSTMAWIVPSRPQRMGHIHCCPLSPSPSSSLPLPAAFPFLQPWARVRSPGMEG
eukprot:359116-Chlamydomonas_euryale.AAC.3